MRAVSFFGAAFGAPGAAGIGAVPAGEGAAAGGAAGAGVTTAEPGGLDGGAAGTAGLGAKPGGFGGIPEGVIGFTAGRTPDGGSGFGAPGGVPNEGGGASGGTEEGAAAAGGVIGAVETRVVSFFGVAAIGEMRIVWPFKLALVVVPSEAGCWGSTTGCAGGEMGGTEPRRTVSRFTPVASPGFEGSVIRTVSFFGTAPGVGAPEGFSSAIIIRFSFSISLLRIYVNCIVHLH